MAVLLVSAWTSSLHQSQYQVLCPSEYEHNAPGWRTSPVMCSKVWTFDWTLLQWRLCELLIITLTLMTHITTAVRRRGLYGNRLMTRCELETPEEDTKTERAKRNRLGFIMKWNNEQITPLLFLHSEGAPTIPPPPPPPPRWKKKQTIKASFWVCRLIGSSMLFFNFTSMQMSPPPPTFCWEVMRKIRKL